MTIESASKPSRTTLTSLLGRTCAFSLATGLSLGLMIVPAGAEVAPAVSTAAVSTAAATDDIPPRLQRACLRVPNLTTRARNTLDRIAGDADVRGSLAWLDAAIATANERGRADLATALENRRAVREATVPVLEQQLERLAAIGERCAAAGVGA